MGEPASSAPPLWPLALYAAAVAAVIAGMVAVSWLLGERRGDRAAGEPFESGMVPTGSARLRLYVGFYLVAVCFVIFDLETAFLVVWAVCARRAGWCGYLEILIFVGVLLAAWAYLWRDGALDWGPIRRGPDTPGMGPLPPGKAPRLQSGGVSRQRELF